MEIHSDNESLTEKGSDVCENYTTEGIKSEMCRECYSATMHRCFKRKSSKSTDYILGSLLGKDTCKDYDDSFEECRKCNNAYFKACFKYIPLNKDLRENNDPVNHPNHYCKGGIECINAIEASMSPEEFQGYCKGNVEKYIWRWREKAGLEDLKKAQVYLTWMIESVEKCSEDERI